MTDKVSFESRIDTALWHKAIRIVSDDGHGFDTQTVIAKFEQLKAEAAEWLADRVTELHLESRQEPREFDRNGEII